MSSLTYPASVPPGSPVQPIPAIQVAGGPLALHITHKLHAGFPSPAADYTADPLDLNQDLVDRVACTFLFDVAGWSMSGAHIVEGDKVVVDRSISPQPGHIVVAIVNGEFTIKRLRLVNGAYELLPENPDFRPIRFGDGEVLEVFGVVVGVARKML